MDVLIFVIIAGVIVGLTSFIVHRLSLKHEVSDAKVVSDKTLAAMAKQNTAAIHALGDKSFQAHHTASELDDALTFKTTPPIKFSEMYGKAKPVVDIQSVANNAKGQHVATIYRYDDLKVPFYVRIDTIKPPQAKQWYLQALSASADESQLISQN